MDEQSVEVSGVEKVVVSLPQPPGERSLFGEPCPSPPVGYLHPAAEERVGRVRRTPCSFCSSLGALCSDRSRSQVVRYPGVFVMSWHR